MSKKKSLEQRIAESPCVYIFHAKCGEKWFWAVDMPGMKREINTAIANAVRAGDRIEFYPPGEDPRTPGYCKCFETDAQKATP